MTWLLYLSILSCIYTIVYLYQCAEEFYCIYVIVYAYINYKLLYMYTSKLCSLYAMRIGMDDILAPLRLKLVEYIRTNIIFRGCFTG